MRHLFLEHPDEPRLASQDGSYYFGPALLVAPVLDRGATAKRIALPRGLYLLWDEARVVEGGGDIEVDAPLERLPLLLRDGHLIPLLDPTIDTLSQEDHPEVIGPSDVSDVYDVVGFVSMETGGASFELWDGGTLSVSWAGGLDLSALAEASGDEDLGRCQGCFLLEELEGGLLRLRVSLTDGRVEAGGLTLDAQTQRKTRWDLYLGQ